MFISEVINHKLTNNVFQFPFFLYTLRYLVVLCLQFSYLCRIQINTCCRCYDQQIDLRFLPTAARDHNQNSSAFVVK